MSDQNPGIDSYKDKVNKYAIEALKLAQQTVKSNSEMLMEFMERSEQKQSEFISKSEMKQNDFILRVESKLSELEKSIQDIKDSENERALKTSSELNTVHNTMITISENSRTINEDLINRVYLLENNEKNHCDEKDRPIIKKIIAKENKKNKIGENVEMKSYEKLSWLPVVVIIMFIIFLFTEGGKILDMIKHYLGIT